MSTEAADEEEDGCVSFQLGPPTSTAILEAMDSGDVEEQRKPILGTPRRASSQRKRARQEAGVVIAAPDSDTPAPRKLFVELDELYVPCSTRGVMEWRETGRWIKYAEAVEVGAERWGQPHVPSISFSAMLDLKNILSNGYVNFSLSADDPSALAGAIVAGMYTSGVIEADDRPLVFRCLLLPHIHVGTVNARTMRSTETYNSLEDYFYRQQRVPKSTSFAASTPKKPHDFLLMPHAREHQPSPNVQRKLSQVPVPVTTAPELRDLANFESPHLIRPVTMTNVDNGVLAPSPTFSSWFGRKSDRMKKRKLKSVKSFTEEFCVSPEALELMKILPADAECAMVMVGAVEFLSAPAMAFVRLTSGLTLRGTTELPLPTRFVFILLGPLNAGLDYHEIGRSMGTLLSNSDFRGAAFRAKNLQQFLTSINDFLDDSIVLPPWKWEDGSQLQLEQIKTKLGYLRQRHKSKARRGSTIDGHEEGHDIAHDGLERTGTLFGGLRREFSQRIKHLSSDFTDAWNLQSIKSVIMTFVSCLFLAITFGAILRKKTKAQMGVKESLIATSAGGVLFALFSAQPLLLLGVTGPMLVFEESVTKVHIDVFEFSKFEVVNDYMGLRVWTSLWALVFCVTTVAFEGTFLIRFVTRFSDDILLTLLSAIFIVESILFITKAFNDHPIAELDYYCNRSDASTYFEAASKVKRGLNSSIFGENATKMTAKYVEKASSFNFQHKYLPNVALLCTIFVLGTFLLAIYVNRVRHSKLFGRTVREALGDFSLSIAVLSFVVIDVILPSDEGTGKVYFDFDDVIDPRSMFVNPMLLNVTGIAISILPGLFLFFIVFLENEVVEVELAKHEHGLRKGTGYNWNLVLAGLINVFCSLFGLPWLCGAPVRTTAHLHSLSIYMKRAPGEKAKVERVLEQRVTGTVLHLLMGLLLVYPYWIPRIPVAVLFGVFLYIGIRNLHGVQMLSRAVLFFVPVKYHPHTLYCLRVSQWRMHLFTVIQLLCFVVVCLVKWCPVISFTFPLAVALTCLLRHLLLPKIFVPVELLALDTH